MKKVTIKGITDSTITFNKTNLILRGNCNNMKLYPNSIATHIEVKNEEQEKELNALQVAKFIEIIVEEEDKPIIPVVENVITKKSNSKRIKKIGAMPIMNSPSGEPLTMKANDVDAPTTDFSIKTDSVDESIKAAEKIDEGEKEEPIAVDELSLDVQERMGNEVVISTGKNVHKKSLMKKSCVEGDAEAKTADPFIDKDEVVAKEIKKADDAFVEKKDDSDETSDAFIEV